MRKFWTNMPEIRNEFGPLDRVHTAGPWLSFMVVVVDMKNSNTICERNLQRRPHSRGAKTCSNQGINFIMVVLNKMVPARQNEQSFIASSESTGDEPDPFRRMSVWTQQVVTDSPH